MPDFAFCSLPHYSSPTINYTNILAKKGGNIRWLIAYPDELSGKESSANAEDMGAIRSRRCHMPDTT